MARRLLAIALVTVAVIGLWTTAVVTQTVQCGGSFVPSLNCIVSGRWNYINTTTSVGTSTQGPIPFQASGTDVTGIISRVTDLSNAQVLALNTTPVIVVPAPGPGYYVSVVRADLIFNYTTAYSSGSDLKLYWSSRGAGNAASNTITASGFLVSVTADTITTVAGGPDGPDPPTTSVPVVLQQVAGTAFAGGNVANSVRVVVNYRIVRTGL